MKKMKDRLEYKNVIIRDDDYITYKKLDWCEEIHDHNTIDGSMIYRRHPDGSEEWETYDIHGNLVYKKYPDGSEEWNTYDIDGNLLYRKRLDRTNVTKECILYTNFGYLIRRERPDGSKEWEVPGIL